MPSSLKFSDTWCRTETFLRAFYRARMLELSEIFAEMLPKMSGVHFKTASDNMTHLTGKTETKPQSILGNPRVVCLFFVCGSEKKLAEREAWTINSHLTWMSNGGICPRTYSKYGTLARLIWRWLMDWYLNLMQVNANSELTFRVVLLNLYLKLAKYWRNPSKKRTARRHSTSNLTCFRPAKAFKMVHYLL